MLNFFTKKITKKYDKEVGFLKKEGYLVSNLRFSSYDRKYIHDKLKKMFLFAIDDKENKKQEYSHFTTRKDRGSLPITTSKEIERKIRNIVARSDIKDIAKQFWGSDNIFYTSKMSHFRYVDPKDPFQEFYRPLHTDYEFLKKDSINICIPITGYGGKYPGLQIFPRIYRNIAEDEAEKLHSVEPEILIGQCLCFVDKVPHRRTTANKSKIRINCEFRIFPEGTEDVIEEFGLIKL